MRFNPKARIDTGRVQDAGGSGGRGGGLGGGPMRIPIPSGKAGGGIGGLLILLLVFVLMQCMGEGGTTPSASGGSLDTSRVADGTDRYASCKTGDDANKSADCARVAVENSMTDYWAHELGNDFRPEAALVTFSGQTQTGCGGATSQVGPFYCPSDQTIYLDTSFFQDVLQQQLNGPAGAFVEPYVLAHEYGHHIQNLLGTMGRVRTQQGPRSDAVRLELQADCYAGMWTKNATSTTDSGGEALISELSQQDIQEAIAAAKSVGDDRIQQQMQGRVSPESWTHGSADSRMKWFMVGYDQGSLQACDTWAVDTP
jgi:uncharacterized protein